MEISQLSSPALNSLSKLNRWEWVTEYDSGDDGSYIFEKEMRSWVIPQFGMVDPKRGGHEVDRTRPTQMVY